MVKRAKCPKGLAFPPCFHTWACPPTELPSSATWRSFRDRSGSQPPCNQGTDTRLFTLWAEGSLETLVRQAVSESFSRIDNWSRILSRHTHIDNLPRFDRLPC